METSSGLCSLEFKALQQSKSHNWPSNASVTEASTTFHWNNVTNAYSHISHYNTNTARSPLSFMEALLRLLLSHEHHFYVGKECMKATNITIFSKVVDQNGCLLNVSFSNWIITHYAYSANTKLTLTLSSDVVIGEMLSWLIWFLSVLLMFMSIT